MSEKLPIVELFHSFQGEGTYMGTPMFFVRTAGCSVGKVVEDFGEYSDQNPLIKHGISFCHTYAGRMRCDTDYRAKLSMIPEEVVVQCKYPRVCLTGGEPCDHKLERLIDLFHAADVQVHLETSGTVYQGWLHKVDWIACSPKQNATVTVLSLAHELRFLYDPHWADPTEEIERILGLAQKRRPDRLEKPDVFISPVNRTKEISRFNMDRAMEYLDKHPRWRLSPQLHKFLEIR